MAATRRQVSNPEPGGGQRQVINVPPHPDDDRTEAGPGVEPGVDDRELGRRTLHADGGAQRAVRLPRGLLQRAAAAFGARLSQPAGVRAAARTGSGGNLTQVSTKPGQVQLAFARSRTVYGFRRVDL